MKRYRCTLSFIILLSVLFLLSSPAFAQDKRGVVLVLSGGGTKGLAHIGILKIIEREKIPIVGIVGTSMGSIIGGLYACGISADELEKIVLETNLIALISSAGTKSQVNDGGHRPMPEKHGIITAQFDKKRNRIGPLGGLSAISLVSFLSKYTSSIPVTDFDLLPIPFAAVATDLQNGETTILRQGNLASAIRASISIPGIFEPWNIEGRLLVDGGLVANLPVKIAKNIFPGHPVLAVNLSGTDISKDRTQFRSVADVLYQAIDIMAIDKIRENAASADLILEPDVSQYGMLDSKGYEALIRKGVESAEANIDALRELFSETNSDSSSSHSPPHGKTLIVRELIIEGLPDEMTPDIYKQYSRWIGKSLDTVAINREADELSRREDFSTVDAHTRPVRNGVAVVLTFTRRPAYEFGLGGYTTNLHQNRWLALTGTGRDFLSVGDSGFFEYHLGPQWAGQLGYFTPLKNNSQWGFVLTGSEEKITPENIIESGVHSYDMERYSLRALHYRNNGYTRIGAGLMAEHRRVNSVGNDAWGPYFHIEYNSLDSAIAPTKGMFFTSNIWWNELSTLLSRSVLQTHHAWQEGRVRSTLRVGLETGHNTAPGNLAILGDQEELYSLSRYPLMAEQVAWGHLGITNNIVNAWWGGINAEIFARYGIAMNNWSRTQDTWETGLVFSIPGQLTNGRFIVVYDEHGEITFGFSIGTPNWLNSAVP